jgi:hypothetical protein
MNGLTYIHDAIPIPDTGLVIVAIREEDGSAFSLRSKAVTHSPLYDLEECFPLVPYLTRLAESGEDVPDYEEVESAINGAKEWIRVQREG